MARLSSPDNLYNENGKVEHGKSNQPLLLGPDPTICMIGWVSVPTISGYCCPGRPFFPVVFRSFKGVFLNKLGMNWREILLLRSFFTPPTPSLSKYLPSKIHLIIIVRKNERIPDASSMIPAFLFRALRKYCQQVRPRRTMHPN